MKKILFISLNDHVPWGGSEELWSKTAVLLSSKYEVSVLIKQWDSVPKQIKIIKDKGVNVIYKSYTNIFKKKSILERIMGKLGLSVPAKTHDFSNVNTIETYDLAIISVGNHVDPKIVTYTQYLRSHKVPYTIIVQLATDLKMIDDELTFQLKDAYEQAEKTYFLSNDNALKTEMQLGNSLNNKELINNPFNLQQKYLGYNYEGQFNMACVASLICFHKSQDLLITVLSQPKWKDRNYCLNLYGNGINKDQIKRLIRLNNLEDKIKLKGFESDKEKIWSQNLACILPSRMEGQSLAMLEAMSFGRMIISTKVGDAEKFIDEGINGYLIEAPTFNLINKVLEKAWVERDNWLNMGIKSRDKLFNVISTDPVIDFSSKLQELLK